MNNQLQTCFLCEGKGQIWPFENQGGIATPCDACKNSPGKIPAYLKKCPHCHGTNKIYDHDDGRGFPKDCKLCNKLGYINFEPIPCTKCGSNGRTWSFPEKRGLPTECPDCQGKGFKSGPQNNPNPNPMGYPPQPGQQNFNQPYPPNQGYNQPPPMNNYNQGPPQPPQNRPPQPPQGNYPPYQQQPPQNYNPSNQYQPPPPTFEIFFIFFLSCVDYISTFYICIRKNICDNWYIRIV